MLDTNHNLVHFELNPESQFMVCIINATSFLGHKVYRTLKLHSFPINSFSTMQN